MTSLLLVALLALVPVSAVAADIERPTDYRDWTHVKSMVILPGHPLADAFGGLHHVYVNDTGRPALARGGPYPDGTVFVFELFASEERDHAFVAGPRKVTAVMVKDADQFKSTGGWGFQAFEPGSSRGIVKDATKECFDCHRSQEKNDFVFSRPEG